MLEGSMSGVKQSLRLSDGKWPGPFMGAESDELERSV